MTEDSIPGIFETLSRCAKISQSAGGIGLSIHNVRAQGSYIKGTGGSSNGVVPMLRVFNDTARYVDQGGGKRKGAFAIYLEPWHADSIQLRSLSGSPSGSFALIGSSPNVSPTGLPVGSRGLYCTLNAWLPPRIHCFVPLPQTQ